MPATTPTTVPVTVSPMSSRDRHTYPHPLAYVRATRGWSQRRLAELLRRLAAERGITLATSKNRVWRWERYGTEPDAETQRVIAAALAIPATVVDERPWPHWLPAWNDADASVAWSAAASMRALHDVTSDAGTDGRRQVGLTGTPLSVLVAAHHAAETGKAPGIPGTPASARGHQLSPDLLDGFRQRTSSLRHLDDRLGGGALRRLVHEELTLVTQLLRQDAHCPQLRRELFSAAAELAQLAGWVAFDTGLHSAAQRYYLSALRTSHTAGDHALGAHVLGCMSDQLAQVGPPGDAVALAQSALAAGRPPGPGKLNSLLYLRLAHAYVVSGAQDQARRALDQTLTSYRETPDGCETASHEPPWLDWFTGSHRGALAARCLTALGHGKEAIPELRTAIAVELTTFPRDALIHLTWLAEAQLSQGEIEAACSALEHALDLGTGLGSARGVELARSVRRRLAAYADVPTVRALAERLDDPAGPFGGGSDPTVHP